MSNTGFRDGFVWGCATASYQIEGAAKTDGRGDSVWDLLCRQPGTVYDGHTGEVADDHYNRYQEDVALLKQLGAMGYRFSVSWSRVLPEGVGAVNEKGLAFYDRLVDSLLEAGVAPYVTLFHWDFPTELYYKGGWLNRDSVKWFADYTKVVVDRLSDRVVNWMTLNEPQCFIGMGHESGIHAPGIQLSTEQVLRAGHHALMAHGAAVQTIREHAKKTPAIGYAPVGSVSIPATDSPEDVEAARQAMFVAQSTSFWDNAWWMDPIFFGHYPEASLEQHGLNVPDYTEADMDLIKQPLDFFGVNTYHGQIVKAGVDGVPQVQGFPPGSAHTAVNWHRRHRLAGSRRQGSRPAANRLSAPASSGVAAGLSRRRRHRRLFGVVAPGQLRVGRRLQGAIRHRVCRLRHPAAHSQRLVLLVPRRHRLQRCKPVGNELRRIKVN
jgi:beta-glucosidase